MRANAVRIELVEVKAWLDMFAAAPPEATEKLGLALDEVAGAQLASCVAIPFPHFNCALGLGLDAPVSREQLLAIDTHYRRLGIQRYCVHAIPPCEPAKFEKHLRANGLVNKSSWDRIFRPADAPALSAEPPPTGEQIVEVTAENAGDWANFVSNIYRFPTQEWLRSLVGRPGWHHYFAIRGPGILAARSIYETDGVGWIGIDAPIPGIMAPTFEVDARLCHQVVAAALARGVREFLTDIEAPSPEREGPAYTHFGSLGFGWLYRRKNFLSA